MLSPSYHPQAMTLKVPSMQPINKRPQSGPLYQYPTGKTLTSFRQLHPPTSSYPIPNLPTTLIPSFSSTLSWLLQLMINKANLRPQRCPSCHKGTLECIGGEYYCEECQQVQIVLEDDVRMVPSKYESNSKGKRQLEQERKLNALLREFTDKYRDLSAEEMALFRRRLAAVKEVTPRKKGRREAAGAVAYLGMAEEIKLSIREYCQQNNLSVRLFNQKYKVYQKLFRSQQHQDDSQQVLKMEEKQEESSPTEKSEALSTALPVLEGARQALSIIFDDVFNKFIYRSRRSEITERLLSRLEGVDGSFLLRIRYSDNAPLKLYYLIFAVLKALAHKINYQQFSEIIQRKTGYLMKRKAATEVRKYYQAFLSERAVKQEGEDEGEQDVEEGSRQSS